MKEHFVVSLDESIVEKFSDKELILVCGGNWVKAILTILSGGGSNICGNNIECENSGNCVQGCGK